MRRNRRYDQTARQELDRQAAERSAPSTTPEWKPFLSAATSIAACLGTGVFILVFALQLKAGGLPLTSLQDAVFWGIVTFAVALIAGTLRGALDFRGLYRRKEGAAQKPGKEDASWRCSLRSNSTVQLSL